MRLFFGLAPDADTTLAIADWRDRNISYSSRPVPPANFHVTLAFVGEIPDPAAERLCVAVDDWLPSSGIRGSRITLDQVGFWNRPGILWLGPTSWHPDLTRLSQKLGSLSGSVGGKRERVRFQPHVTLYRRCIEAPAAPTTAPNIVMHYQHITLFESRQGRSGVSYYPIEDWALDTQQE